MRLTSTITFSMVAISGREEEQEEALCCDGGARKILEGKEAEDRGESRSSVSEVCPSTEQIEGVTVTAAVVTATFFVIHLPILPLLFQVVGRELAWFTESFSFALHLQKKKNLLNFLRAERDDVKHELCHFFELSFGRYIFKIHK